MAMAGWKTEEMLNGIEGIMNLAAASGEDLALTSDIVTDALTAFGHSAADSGRLADILAAAASNSNTNVAMMGDTFKYVAPVAGTLSYTMEDTALAIGLMANRGIKASQAGTSLRAVLTRLVKPTKEVTVGLEKLGMDGEIAGKSLRQVLTEMRTGWANLSDTEQASAAAMIAGREGMSGLAAILNASDADWIKLANAIDNSAGAAERMAKIRLDNLAGDLEQMGGAFETLQLKFYYSQSGMLRELVQDVTSVLDVYNQTGDLAEAAQRAGELIPNVLSAILSGGTAFNKNLGTVFEKALESLANDPNFSKNVSDFVKSFLSLIGTALKSSNANVGKIVQNLIEGIKDGIAPEDAKAIFDEIITAGGNVADFFVAAIVYGIEHISKDPNIPGMVSGMLGGMLDGGIKIFNAANANFPALGEKIIQGMDDSLTGERIAAMLKGAMEAGANLVEFTDQSFETLADNLVNGIENGLSPEDAARIIGGILSLAVTSLSFVGDVADDFLETLTVGMQMALQNNDIEKFTQAFLQYLKVIAQITSENAPEIGGIIGEGLAELIVGLLENPEWLADTLKAHATTPRKIFWGFLKGLFSQFTESDLDLQGAFAEWIAGDILSIFGMELPEEIKKKESEVSQDPVTNAISEWMSGIFSKLKIGAKKEEITAEAEIVTDVKEKVAEDLKDKETVKDASEEFLTEIQSQLLTSLSALKKSGNLNQVGQMLLEAIIAGMNDKKTVAALSDAVLSVKDAMSGESVLSSFYQSGKDIGQSIMEGVINGIQENRDEFFKIVSELRDLGVQEHETIRSGNMIGYRVSTESGGVFGGSGDTVTHYTTNNFNSPKALDEREMLKELQRIDQYNQIWA